MNWDEYNKLFHALELNLVAFKPLMECDKEVLKLINAAIEEEREACAKLCDELEKSRYPDASICSAAMWACSEAIRARGQK